MYEKVTALEIRLAIAEVHSTQVALAKALGVSERTVRNWTSGSTECRGPSATLFKMWLAGKRNERKKPPGGS